ncbi:MAG: hypothetical protein C5B52_15485 [Bacteroidetes bacterium]|nr:MAG: hypothetical protein C5B52_15485 [Bacteroidota bacterium]
MKAIVNRIVSNWTGQYRNNLLLKRLTTILGIDILVKASGFILLPIYLRLMTQEEYGLYNYLLSIITTFAIVLNFGLYVPLSKFYHDCKTEKEKGTLLFTIFSLLIVLLILIVAPVYLFRLDFPLTLILFKNSIQYNSYRIIVLLALLMTVFSFMLTNFFYTSEKITIVKRYNLTRIIGINLITLAALIYIDKDAVQTRIQFTYLSELLIFLVFVGSLIREFYNHFDSKLALTALRMGLPIMISAIFGIIINFSDKFFLEKYGSLRELSNYYLAFSFASIIPTIFASLQNVWVPLFMKEKDLRVNLQKTNRLVFRLTWIFLIIGVAMWVCFRILLITGIIPRKYAEVSYILPILLITQIIASLAPLFSNYLIYFHKTFSVSVAGLVACGISVGLGLILVPAWGVYGAALVNLSSNLFYLIVFYLLVKYYANRHLINLNSEIVQA